jgi:quinol monooxygenase YgiN
MTLTRRLTLTSALALGLILTGPAASAQTAAPYGLIGSLRAAPGKRDALVAILAAGTGGMPGCLSYVVARDTTDADTIWVTEVWDTKASHDASLSLPAVRAAIAKARPLIAGFGAQTVTAPAIGAGTLRAAP